MAEDHCDEAVDITWNGLDIHVTLKKQSWHSDFIHIEIRCKEPLPMTNTGYRSHFMQGEAFAQYESLEAFILAWLEEASQSKDWKQIWDARQQLSFGF
ncbi:MAG: hypothetical protein AAF429_06445 [Pseudomonadota bacterium]